jgi:hypothetical protein
MSRSVRGGTANRSRPLRLTSRVAYLEEDPGAERFGIPVSKDLSLRNSLVDRWT